jgi:hypothetical protein
MSYAAIHDIQELGEGLDYLDLVLTCNSGDWQIKLLHCKTRRVAVGTEFCGSLDEAVEQAHDRLSDLQAAYTVEYDDIYPTPAVSP